MFFLINSIIKINAFDGKYVVLAGSGSGKTKVLVERTAILILEGKARDGLLSCQTKVILKTYH